MDVTIPDLSRGDILVRDGRIEAVAEELQIDGADILDARGMIAVPGFVDAHRHTWQTQLHGIRTDWNHLDYMTYVRGMLSACYDPEDAYLGNLVGALEALDSGITTLVDHSHLQISEEHSDGLVRGLKESGIRGIFCYGTYRNPSREEILSQDLSGLLNELAGPLSHWHRANAERVRSKHFSDRCAPLKFGIATSEFSKFQTARPMIQEIEWARSLDPQRITMHVATTANEPLRSVSELARVKLLGPDLLFVHGNHLNDSELTDVVEAGASIVSTIEPEMTYGAWPVVERLQRIGGTASMGIDVLIDFSGDMFGQMRALLNVWRLQISLRNPNSMTRKVHQKKVLEIATIEGAKAVGLDAEIGSLTPGKCADVVLVRKDTLGMVPMNNPYAAIVSYGNSSLVDTVILNGKIVKRAGALVGVNWPSLKSDLLRSHGRIAARAGGLPEQAIRRAWASRFRVEIEQDRSADFSFNS
jgi:cytosine/adenosine deaminase-related metal-dependent hydrolase